ncbi:cation channel sperm-associated protein 4-like [Diadema antillarum]|uniref:cation channel sperm-associated protein 4-like n=1 Tax=Diadema antillarum TaxID=105358 RepID=UPI003A84B53B
MSEEGGEEPAGNTVLSRPMGWVRRTSKQVENAGAAFKKLGLKVKLANTLGSQKKKKKEEEDETPRLFTFDLSAVQRGASLCDLFENDEVEEDFNEIVDVDDERVEEVVSQELVGRMVDSVWFRGMIMGVIVVNAILIGLQTKKEWSQQYAWLFFIFDYTVLSIFVCELFLKWYNGFVIYWRIGWNILDFFIILTLLLGPALTFLGSSRILRILRVLRAFRGLRSVSALTGLSVVVQTIFQSIPDMTNIALLLVILMLVLSVVGVFLFGEDFPLYFGNLRSAMFSLFICVTQDGWMGVFDKFKNSPHYLIAGIYFIIAIVIGAFVFANLVVAVVVTNLDKAIKEVKHENKMREDILSTKAPSNDDEIDHNKELPIKSIDDVTMKTDMSTQKPLYFGDFENLTTEKFQNYIVIVAALEENLAEYRTIKEDLDKIFQLIWELNEDYGEVEGMPSQELASKIPDTSLDLKNFAQKGDILSNLLRLEQHNLVSTRRGSMGGLIKDAAKLLPTQTALHSGRRRSRDAKSVFANRGSKADLAEQPRQPGDSTSQRTRRNSEPARQRLSSPTAAGRLQRHSISSRGSAPSLKQDNTGRDRVISPTPPATLKPEESGAMPTIAISPPPPETTTEHTDEDKGEEEGQ